MSRNEERFASGFNPRWNQWPLPDDERIREALLQAYEDGSWGRYEGPHGDRLEEELAAYHGVRHILLCASGTIAVQIALRALQLPKASEVILAGYDFPGNFRAIQDCGLVPHLVDLQEGTWCLDPQEVERAISAKTSAIVASHLHGCLADLPRIKALAQTQGVVFVEDACQAPGATLAGQRAGTWGDIGVLSFGGSKLLTAGRGGALLTNRTDLYQRAKIYCERGNHAFPLSQLQAAVLVPQMAQLDAWNRIRMRSIQLLRERLRMHSDQLRPAPWRPDWTPSFYKHGWLGISKSLVERLVRQAEVEGIPLTSGFRGFHRRPLSQAARTGSLDIARIAAERTLLLHHPILLQEEQAIHWLADWIIRELEQH